YARDALRESSLAGVSGEGGNALWGYCTQVEAFKTLRHMADEIPLRNERTLAIAALDHAISIEPDTGRWRSYRISILDSRSGTGKSNTLSVADAYHQANEDIRVLKGKERLYMLGTLAKLAFRAAAWNDARNYAQELLDSANDNPDWNSGNAVFYGNMI